MLMSVATSAPPELFPTPGEPVRPVDPADPAGPPTLVPHAGPVTASGPPGTSGFDTLIHRHETAVKIPVSPSGAGL